MKAMAVTLLTFIAVSLAPLRSTSAESGASTQPTTESYAERRRRGQEELNRRLRQAEGDPEAVREVMRWFQEEYQMGAMRQGLPPLPMQLTPEMDDALVGNRLPPTDNQSRRTAAKSEQAVLASQDEMDWQKATGSFSVRAIQQYIEMYPQSKHAEDGRQILRDEETVENIVKNGVDTRFVVPEEALPLFVALSVRNARRGRTVLSAMPGAPSFQIATFRNPDAIPSHVFTARNVFGATTFSVVGMGQQTAARDRLALLPCGDRSVFVIHGTVHNVAGSSKDPIRFVYLEKKGLVYLGGQGEVRNLKGEVIFKTP